MKRLFFYYLRYPHDIRMKYCGCGWGCGCQNSCGYPRMRIRMRSSDTPLVSITNVGLILTKLRWFQHFSTSQNSNFELFWKKNQIFGFPCCSTRKDLSIDVLITNVGLILTKLRLFQLFSTSQNLNFELFWKKKSNFLGWHRVVLVKTFPLMYQLLM